MISFGLGAVLLLRNPLKAPADERLFRALWLGAIGRAAFGIGASSTKHTTASSTQPARAAIATRPALANTAPSFDERLGDLEERVKQLERR